MFIKEIIFNKIKYQGMRNVPATVTVKSGSSLVLTGISSNSSFYQGQTVGVKKNAKLKCLRYYPVYDSYSWNWMEGDAYVLKDQFLVKGNISDLWSTSKDMPFAGLVSAQNVIWGGNHLLSHLWQMLRAFTARKAVNA